MRILRSLFLLALSFAMLGCSTSERSFVFTRNSLPASGLPLPSSMAEPEFEAGLYDFLGSRRYVALGWRRDKRIRDTGPYQNGQYYGTHPAVRIYYSPEVITWLESDRRGDLPNGSMIIKEMFTPPAARYEGKDDEIVPTQWTVMVRDTNGAHDGWFWSYFSSNPENKTPPVPQPPDNDDFPFNYPNSGFGLYCVRCHGSAETTLTFAATGNIEGFPGQPILYAVDDSWKTDTTPDPVPHPNRSDADGLPGAVRQALSEGVINQEFLDYFNQFPAQSKGEIAKLPPVTRDRVVAKQHRQFVSSSQCLSCHSGDTSPFGPNMVKDGVDISPWGEWSWSMMGLAGRDPIFFAQMETEIAVHAVPGGDLSPEQIQNFCLRCHGVMGQRQFTLDNPDKLFTIDHVLNSSDSDPNDHYGGLARDGVSCMVCHQIQDQTGLPIQDIDTGRFIVGPAVNGLLEVFGPYRDVVGHPMVQSLGILPKHGQHIESSLICASCHSVDLPVLNEAGKTIDTKYEQSTYFEWLNSAFAQEPSSFQSCQGCHMPNTFHGPDPLEFKIANVQDQDFPETDHVAPGLHVPPRGDYSRHVLAGINVFGLEFFRNYPEILGVQTKSFMTGFDNGIDNSIENSLSTAADSATVEILSSAQSGLQIESLVKVTNLAGHRFPSGVGFRRLFVEFLVKDSAGEVLWGSGRTNDIGVIVDENGIPLPSESHADLGNGEQAFEPHYQVVNAQDKAQVYAELIKGADGKFNTTFLGRVEEVKDNRLLPLGWTAAGPAGMEAELVETTRPVGEAASDPDFIDGTGSDTVTYRATLPVGATGPFTVEAHLFYQAIPPIYLQNRFDQAKGPATRRLHYMASRLNTDQTSFPGWKLRVAEATRAVGP